MEVGTPNIKNANSSANSDYNKFDLDKFKREFVFKKERAAVENKIKSQEKLNRLTEAANIKEKSLHNLSIAELFIGIKDTWFGILDDLLAQKIESQTLTKNNRLFFIGFTIVVITCFLYLYNFFLEEEIMKK